MKNEHGFNKKIISSWLFAAMAIAVALPESALSANSGITYHGRILNPDGSPLTSASVKFDLKILTPGTEACLLYEEIQTLDMQNSNGVFAITLDDGTGTRTDTSGYTVISLTFPPKNQVLFNSIFEHGRA